MPLLGGHSSQNTCVKHGAKVKETKRPSLERVVASGGRGQLPPRPATPGQRSTVGAGPHRRRLAHAR